MRGYNFFDMLPDFCVSGKEKFQTDQKPEMIRKHNFQTDLKPEMDGNVILSSAK